MATSALVIEELGGKKRRLELKGAGLPFQGATWGGTTTIATQWNPGNPEATQHVLGPRETPSQWEGEWNTLRLIKAPCTFSEGGGAAQTVVYPSTLMTILDTMRRDGQLLGVTWTNEKTVTPSIGAAFLQTFKVYRMGRLSDATFKVARMDDITWTATFDWMGRGEAQQPSAERQENVLALIRKSMSSLNDAAAAVMAGNLLAQGADVVLPTPFSLGQLEALVDGPMQMVDSFARAAQAVTHQLKDVGDLVLKVRDMPSAMLGRLVDVANNAVAVSNQFQDELSRKGPEALTTRSKISNLVTAASYYGKAQRQADLVAGVSASLVLGINQRRSRETFGTSSAASRSSTRPQDIMAVHVPRQGETMLIIARRYYGSADLAGPLCRANGLPASTIIPPRIAVIVPSREVLESVNRI